MSTLGRWAKRSSTARGDGASTDPTDPPAIRLASPHVAAVIGATALLFVFHLWVSHRVIGPSVVFDESGYLGNARWLAGNSNWRMPRSPSYAAGYSLLLMPIMRVFGSPETQWHAVHVLNAGLLASVFPLLVTIQRRILLVRYELALASSAVGALTPGIVAVGISAIAENVVLPLVLLTVLSSWWMTASGRTHIRITSYLFGPVVAMLVFSHPRFTVVAPIVVLLVMVAAARQIVTTSTAAANVIALTVLVIAGRQLTSAVVSDRWQRVEQLEGDLSAWLGLVRSLDGWRELGLGAVGQGWYLAAGSLGLAVAGVVVVARLVSGSSLPAGRGAGDAPSRRADVRFTFGIVSVMAAAVFATSVLFFAQNQFRADHWIYGRHNDSFSPLWVALGITGLAQHSPRWRRWVLVISVGVVGASGTLLTAVRRPLEIGGGFSPFAVPAVIRWVGGDPEVALRNGTWAALAGIGVLAILTIPVPDTHTTRLARSRSRYAQLPLALVASTWFVYAGFGTVQGTANFASITLEDWSIPASVDRLGIRSLDIEERTARSLPTLTYPFYLPLVDIGTYEAERGEQPTGPFALARLDDPRRTQAGDRAALLDVTGYYGAWDAPWGLALWVAPGPEQRRLDAAGLLLPPGFPSPLPEAARRAEIRLPGGPGQIHRLTPAGTTTIQASVEHAGAGSPWPDQRSFARPGRVRVRAVAVPVGRPDNPTRVVGFGELPRWMHPGDVAMVDVALQSTTATSGALVPGRYRATLEVEQVEGGWSTSGGPDAWFWLVVSG